MEYLVLVRRTDGGEACNVVVEAPNADVAAFRAVRMVTLPDGIEPICYPHECLPMEK